MDINGHFSNDHPTKIFQIIKVSSYCSKNGHKRPFLKFSPHQNPLNCQNIIRTAAHKMNIFKFLPNKKPFELSKYNQYCSINGHKRAFFKFSPHQNPLNCQNIILTAACMDINKHFSNVHPTKIL